MFLEELTEDLIAKYGVDGLGSLTLVFPTRRAALVVNGCIRRYLEKNDIRRPVQAPAMTTLSGLFDALSSLGQDDELRLVSRLYDVYCRCIGQQLPLDVFYSWGRQMIQDFSMLDKSYPEVTPDSFLTNAAAARRLEELELDEEVRLRLEALVAVNGRDGGNDRSTRRSFEQLWEQMPAIYAEFRKVVGSRTYEGARMKEVLLHWDTCFVQEQIRGRMFVFAGFNYLVPAELELMRRLQALGQAKFYWDYPAGGTFSCNPKAFKWVQRNAEQKIKSNELPLCLWQRKDVEVVTTTSVHAEAQFVWQWLKEHHHTGDRTGVVLCDETMLEQVIAALPDVEPDDPQRFARINVTKGFPLKYTPVFAFVKDWLSDRTHDRQSGETWVDVMRRLSEAVAAYGSEKRADAVDTERLVDIESAEEEVTEEWDVLLTREAHYQMMLALNRFTAVVEEELVGKLQSLSGLRLLLRRYLENVSLPFHGEPLTDIQIIGVLETRAMDFDNLLILNAEEGVVPNTGEDLSYFPFYLRKAYGMLTSEESTDVYAYNFFRLMRRARHVTLTYCGSESKNNRKTMSRFVMQMLTGQDFAVRKVALFESNEIRAPYCLTPDTDSGSLQDILHVGEDGLMVREDGRVFRLSPSAMNTYRKCPMEFWLTYVRHVSGEEVVGEVLSRGELGQLVHLTIQCLYEHLNGGPVQRPFRLTEQILDSVTDTLLEQMLEKAYLLLNEEWLREHLDEPEHYVREVHVVENATVMCYVSHILQADRLAAAHGLEILALERDCSFVVEVPGVGRVRVGGRIDRIDRLGGQVRIVDYKTGGADAAKLRMPVAETLKDSVEQLFVRSDKVGYQLQTLVYAEAFLSSSLSSLVGNGEVLPAIYFVREQAGEVAQYVTMEQGRLAYRQVRDVFLEVLARQVGIMLTDRQHDRAEEGHCDNYCPFFILCNRVPKDF